MYLSPLYTHFANFGIHGFFPGTVPDFPEPIRDPYRPGFCLLPLTKLPFINMPIVAWLPFGGAC